MKYVSYLTQQGQIKELFHLFYPLTLTYPKKEIKNGGLSAWLRIWSASAPRSSAVIKNRWELCYKIYAITNSITGYANDFHCASLFSLCILHLHEQTTHIHTHRRKKKNYNDGCHGSVRIRADWFTSWLVSILWSHDLRTASYVIKRVSEHDAFNIYIKYRKNTKNTAHIAINTLHSKPDITCEKNVHSHQFFFATNTSSSTDTFLQTLDQLYNLVGDYKVLHVERIHDLINV